MPPSTQEPGQSRHANPVAGFIIGLAIILLASILNAAGLNLTKLDHVRSILKSLPLSPAPTVLIGAHKCNSKDSTKEGLDATVMAPWNGSLYVR